MSASQESEKLRSLGIAVIAVGVVVAGLVLGSSFLIPLAIAMLLWNLLEAIIGGIASIGFGSLRVPRAVATLLGVAVVGLGFYLVFSVILGQTDAISAVWPRYVSRFEALVQELSLWLGAERSAKMQQLVRDFDLNRSIPGLLASAQSFMVSFLLVVAYVGFLLAESGNVKAKISAMASNATEAENMAALFAATSGSIRSYIWIKTLVSTITAVVSYIVLRWIGIDFAETWAILIFVLNFIPNIGSIIAVIFPAIIALVQFETLSPFVTLVIVLTLVQFTIGTVLEPLMMGSSLNMSPFAIIAGLAFWGSIWGVVGMFLSVPILVLVMIVCANVPSWRWIAVLLSKDGRVVV